MFRGSRAIDCDYFDFFTLPTAAGNAAATKIDLGDAPANKNNLGHQKDASPRSGGAFCSGFVPNNPGQLIAIILIFFHCLSHPAMPRTSAMPRPTKTTSATKRKHHHVPGAHFVPGLSPTFQGN